MFTLLRYKLPFDRQVLLTRPVVLIDLGCTRILQGRRLGLFDQLIVILRFRVLCVVYLPLPWSIDQRCCHARRSCGNKEAPISMVPRKSKHVRLTLVLVPAMNQPFPHPSTLHLHLA